jgi:hypothetical protein
VNDTDKRELLVRLAAGEIGRSDPAVAAAAASDQEFATAIDELLAVRTGLDAAARVERELLAGHGAVTGSGPDVVGDTIRRLAAASAPAGRRSLAARWRWPLTTLAAAAAAAVLVFLLTRGDGPADDDRTLGAKQLELLEPTGSIETGFTFRWRCTEPGASFRAEIFDPAAPGGRTLPARDEGPETEWHVDADSLRAVRPHHRWRVVARIHSGEIVRDAPLPR